jgi:hypothetical protein
LLKSVGDPLDDRVDLGDHFMIPDPNQGVTSAPDKLCSAIILIQLVGVLRTVELDNKLRLETKEVSDEWSDWMLPTELESLKLPAA